MRAIDWETLKRHIPVGSRVMGKIISHHPFGVFVDLGYSYEGIIEIMSFRDEGISMSPAEYPAIGTTVTAVVTSFKESHAGCQIRLSIQPSKLGLSALS